MRRLILIAISLLFYNQANSCTCFMERKISVEAFLDEGLVFKGKIIKLDTIYGRYENLTYPEEIVATFKVENWISFHDVSDTVVVYTGMGVGDCGISFFLDETWLIFTMEHDGIHSTSICLPSIQMISKNDKNFISKMEYLKRLKSTTGHIRETLEWYNGPYTISGNLKNGKPVGEWLRMREKDTIAIFNFNTEGRRQGYQMEDDEDHEYTSESFEDASEKSVKTYDPNKINLRSFYELKNGLRHGKFEIYWDGELHLKATYVNGHLDGEYVTWHEDTAIAKGKIRTVKQFQRDVLVSSIRFDEAGNIIKY